MLEFGIIMADSKPGMPSFHYHLTFHNNKFLIVVSLYIVILIEGETSNKKPISLYISSVQYRAVVEAVVAATAAEYVVFSQWYAHLWFVVHPLFRLSHILQTGVTLWKITSSFSAPPIFLRSHLNKHCPYNHKNTAYCLKCLCGGEIQSDWLTNWSILSHIKHYTACLQLRSPKKTMQTGHGFRIH